MDSLTGSVYNIIFRNEQNGYTVFELGGESELNVVCGCFASLSEGEYIQVEGQWKQHRDYGLQFAASGYKSITPKKLSDIEEYLASGVIKGIGPSTARAIVDAFGNDTLDIMEMAPGRLSEVPGIGKSRARQIAKSYAEVAAAREDTMFLQGLGLGSAMCARIIKQYGAGLQMRIRANPYALIEDIDGIGFRIADSIARQLGVNADDDYRVVGGLRHVLQQAQSDGHVYLPFEELLSTTAALLDVQKDKIEDALRQSAIERRFIMRQLKDVTAVYLPALYSCEQKCACIIAGLTSQAENLFVQAELDQLQSEIGITLAPVQQEAVRLALSSGVSVITGGPGTGKTTIIKCIIGLMYRHGQKISLCAPTGRAAKRMTEATGAEAKTIHRLLDYSPDKGFEADEDNPLDADVLIVDEASMIDIFLMRALLLALKRGCRLVLVGDADQLPSVGAGNVLGDIVASGCVPLVRLRDIFRQDGGSMIVLNAHKINNGVMPELDNKSKDFFFEAQDDENSAAQCVLALCTRRLPAYFNVDPLRDIQVLCPQKKGGCGVIRMNQLLQAELNPSDGSSELRSGENSLRLGDKVMQTRNNYDIKWRRLSQSRVVEEGEGIFNGDIGYVSEMFKSSLTVSFEDGKEAQYEGAMLEDLMLAYAISVHKSQGCEFKIVVMPLIGGPPMLYARNLLYTAVTRARRAVILVGKRETVRRMVNNNIISKRYSNLCALLRQNPGPEDIDGAFGGESR